MSSSKLTEIEMLWGRASEFVGDAYVGEWKNGKKNDIFEWYYENGQLIEQVTYKDGIIDWIN